MKYYVVSDVHGYYTVLEETLRGAGFFEDPVPNKLIVCGDLLDRGTEANRMVDFMLQLLEEGRLILVKGNHEDLMVQCLQEVARGRAYDIAIGMSHHYSNGTWDTLLQIANMSESDAIRMPNELVGRVMRSPFYTRLLSACMDYFETPHYIFTHGWIPCHTEGYKPYTNYAYDPDWRTADVDAWRRARWFNGMEVACQYHVTEPNKTVVSGHWHTAYGHACIEHRGTEWGIHADFSPFYAEGIIAIDASTANSGKMNCLVIED